MSCDKQPVYIVDIIGECIPIGTKYTYGRQIQILNFLQMLNNNGEAKYPLVALYQDFGEKRGRNMGGYYAQVVIPRILIACLTTSTDTPDVRYGVTFKPILYPIYYSFVEALANHVSIVENDVDDIMHTKWDRPGTLPTNESQNEYIDAIEINNLTLTIIQQIL
jgi:hypothetical protein